jgi:hypothetical protein
MRQRWALAIVIALLVLLFLVLWTPHIVSNPRVNDAETLEAALSPPSSVETTLRKACNDCHSNRTEWPWYAHLRPIASRIRNDVRDGRRALNFSQWRSQTRGDLQIQKKTLETSCALMQAGMMPPPYYLYIHPNAKLANAEIRGFCAWARSIGQDTTR